MTQPKERTVAAIRLAAVLAAVALAYAGSLANGFTNWDDPLVLELPAVAGFNLRAMVLEPAIGHYYPLTLLSLALDRALGGGGPFWFHFTSLLLHLAATALVYSIALRLPNGRPGPALAVAALFGLHPLGVEAVAWTSARNYPLAAVFGLGAVVCYLRHLEHPDGSRRWFLAGFGLFCAAMLCRAAMLTLPLLLLGLDWIARRRDWKRLVLEKALFLVPIVPMSWATLHARAVMEGPVPEIFTMDLPHRLLWGIKGAAFYASRTLFPRDLSAYYDIRLVSPDAVDWALAAAAVIVCLLPIARGQTRSTRVLGGLLFLAALAPVLKAVPFGEYSVFNDRYAYFTMIGLLVAVVTLAADHPLLERPAARWPVLAVTVAACLALGLAARQRVRVWHDSEALWSDVIAKYPRTSMAHNNLGRFYLERGSAGDMDKARTHFLAALEDRPNLAMAHYNLGLVAQRTNDPAAASAFFRKAIEARPAYPEAWNNLGTVFRARNGDPATAAQMFRNAIAAGGAFPEAWYNMGVALVDAGKKDEGVQAMRALLEQWPGFHRADLYLAMLDLKQGDSEKAAARLERATRDPSEVGRAAAAMLQELRRK